MRLASSLRRAVHAIIMGPPGSGILKSTYIFTYICMHTAYICMHTSVKNIKQILLFSVKRISFALFYLPENAWFRA